MISAGIVTRDGATAASDYAEHIYDITTKYLARDSGEWALPSGETRRHDYLGGRAPGEAGRHSEAWRFPFVEAHYQADESREENALWNEVTFVYASSPTQPLPAVTVVGLPEPTLREVTLPQIENSIYRAATVLLRAGRVYDYQLVIGGVPQPDPINPQRRTLPNGEEVSTFFTLGCFAPVILEPWERSLIARLTQHILPFNSREEELFQLRPGSGSAKSLSAQLHKFDHGIGVANYIDKLLAREERHHLVSYKSCLAQINRILRTREPFLEPRDIPEQTYVTLYRQMASGNTVPDWNYQLYDNPGYFLFLLRRHVWTGAFSHPKYGGNANGFGWLWLSDQFPFAYESALETPLGTNASYRG